MKASQPRRTPLFATDPISGLRGLSSLTDPDDGVSAVIDLPVIGARGDGKSQFIIHAIRALHAHAPALDGAELDQNRDVMRLVLDPRAVRPEATPPGVVPHFTFRVRAGNLLSRLSTLGASKLAWRASGQQVGFAFACMVTIAGLAIAFSGRGAIGLLVGASGALIGGIAALLARRRLRATGDIEVVFWDVAGEQIYSAMAADYYAMLGRLVDARRRRAAEQGRAYAFAPILICNPLALGVDEIGSPYERLRQLLPLFGALDGDAVRALVAVNRWSVVDPLCTRGAPRDEVVEVIAHAHDEPPPTEPTRVVREQVRAHCLDAEDGRDGDVRITYLRYDTAIRSTVDAGRDESRDVATLSYVYDDGPGAFGGSSEFLEWAVGLVRWTPVVAPIDAPITAPVEAPLAAEPAPIEVWARPARIE